MFIIEVVVQTFNNNNLATECMFDILEAICALIFYIKHFVLCIQTLELLTPLILFFLPFFFFPEAFLTLLRFVLNVGAKAINHSSLFLCLFIQTFSLLSLVPSSLLSLLFRIFPDLSSTDMVVVIVKGMNLPAPSGKNNHCYLSGLIYSTAGPHGVCKYCKIILLKKTTLVLRLQFNFWSLQMIVSCFAVILVKQFNLKS